MPILAMSVLLCVAATPAMAASLPRQAAVRAPDSLPRVGRGRAVPSGFQPGSASFLSANAGFVLGAVNCPPGHFSCRPWLVATTDGGRHWSVLATPPRGTQVDNLAFASDRVGWIYGSGLWVTRDGAARWRRLAVRGRVESLAIAGATAYAIVVPPRSETSELVASPVGRDEWRPVRAVGDVSELTTAGTTVWAASGSGAWTRARGRWQEHPFACAGNYQLIGIAAASKSWVDFLCASSAAFNTGEEGIEIMTSRDGGRSVHLAGRKGPVIGDGGTIALPPRQAKVLTFAGSAGIPSWIGRSADGGRTWRRVGLFGDGPWRSLAYVTAATGFIVLGTPGYGGHPELLRTTDAGLRWRPVRI